MTPDSPPNADSRGEQERLSLKFQRELNAGLVGLVLLAVLDQAGEDLYGYQIAKRLQALANGARRSSRARCTRCCASCRLMACWRAESSRLTLARRAGTTGSPRPGGRRSRSGVGSGAARGISSMGLRKRTEPPHERQHRPPLDRAVPGRPAHGARGRRSRARAGRPL